MKPNPNPDDPHLTRVLRAARPEAELPARFQEGVWRRIAEGEAPVRADVKVSWLDALAALVLRPRFAMAAAALLIVAGASLGAREANQSVRQEAQARYVAAVAPSAVR